jgi:putative ABC transport system ATP-binding protein
MDERTIIAFEDVSKVFRTEDLRTHALSDVTFSIEQGEYVAISGPSGCGKSTLLSIMGLLDSPTSGEYRLNGQRLAELSPRAKAALRNRQIGFIFQSFNLLGHLTVGENVALPLTYRSMSASTRREKVEAALAKVAMRHRAAHHPAQLSGGQQQRVAVARALVGAPAILLADEPTGNLDSKNGDAVMELLRELHQGGATICVVTHDPRYAAHADREVHMLDGRVLPSMPGFEGTGFGGAGFGGAGFGGDREAPLGAPVTGPVTRELA